MFKRPSNRNFHELRNIVLQPNISPYAEGSCISKFGNTHVLCTASIDNKLPLWLRNSGKGWITAEYGMLPRSTHTRMDREVTKGKPSGRTQEIQRLIGRSLRSVVDLKKLGEYQIKIDRLFEKKYIKNLFEEENLDLSLIAFKIQSGHNKNEITLVPKSIKKRGFFEKFFQLFS